MVILRQRFFSNALVGVSNNAGRALVPSGVVKNGEASKAIAGKLKGIPGAIGRYVSKTWNSGALGKAKIGTGAALLVAAPIATGIALRKNKREVQKDVVTN